MPYHYPSALSAPRKGQTVLLKFGSAHGYSRPYDCAGDSRMDTNVYVNFNKIHFPTSDTVKPPQTELVEGAVSLPRQIPDADNRVKLTNTVCKHFQGGTCPNGNCCIFLHGPDEKALPCISYDGSEASQYRHVVAYTDPPTPIHKSMPTPHGPNVDAVIYVKNLPRDGINTMSNEEWLTRIGKSYGKVTCVTLLTSRLQCGRIAGFMHMTSLAQAEKTVERLNNICASGEFIHAHIEKCIPKYTPPPPVARSLPLPVKPKKPAVRPSFTVLEIEDDESNDDGSSEDEDEEDEGEEDEIKEDNNDAMPNLEEVIPVLEKDKPGPSNDATSPMSIMGLNPWSDNAKRNAICNELCVMRMEKEQEKAAYEQSLMQLRLDKNMRKLIDATVADDSAGKDIDNGSSPDCFADESDICEEDYSDYEDDEDEDED